MLAFTTPDCADDGDSRPHSPMPATAISDVEKELGLESLLADMQSTLDLDLDLDLGSPPGAVGGSDPKPTPEASDSPVGAGAASGIDLSLALGDDDEFEASLDNFLSTLDK